MEHWQAIISHLKSADINVRIDTLKRAQQFKAELFKGQLSIAELAQRCLIVEQLYNLVRVELKQEPTKLTAKQEPSENGKLKIPAATERKPREKKPSGGTIAAKLAASGKSIEDLLNM